jgi:hypothetical protein
MTADEQPSADAAKQEPPSDAKVISATAAAEPSYDPASDYLDKLLRNIATMLSYTSTNGIALPEDLRGTIDQLFRTSEVKNYPKRIFVRQ